MKYVFEVLPDYVGPGSNWPLSKLSDYDAIPEPLKASIVLGCNRCTVALLGALWGDRYAHLNIKKDKRYITAPLRIKWRHLLAPTDPDAQKYMDRHMLHDGS